MSEELNDRERRVAECFASEREANKCRPAPAVQVPLSMALVKKIDNELDAVGVGYATRNIVCEIVSDSVDQQVAAAPAPATVATEAATIDIDLELWDSIKKAAAESDWIPAEYSMNDWASDVCAFLRSRNVATEAVAHCGNEGCGWSGPAAECVKLKHGGAACCPECHDTTETDAVAQGWTEQDALNALRFESDGPFGQDDVDQMLRLMQHIDMLREQKAVAQGGGVDVEKVMALVEEYATAVSNADDNMHRGNSKYQADFNTVRDALYHQIRALLSASPAASGWQPIETAPKDGTPVMLLYKGYIVEAVWECVDSGDWEHGYGPSYWWDSDLVMMDDGTEPTHWMPRTALPAAPAIAKQGEE